ncbi:MAG: hypothetical protein ACQEXJ_11480 [Myxococcota bacterium]
MTIPVRGAAALALGALLTIAACGGVKTATRTDAPQSTSGPFLVEVVDRMPEEPVSLVSLSVLGLDPEEEPPLRPDEATVETMRRAAAAQGAEMLVLERVVMPWRKAFYGFGIRREEGGISPRDVATCEHPEAREGLEDARDDAEDCLAEVKQARPAVSGRVVVTFQVDAFGSVYRAAASPDSSRDSQVRRCALRSVVKGDFGDHTGLLCSMEMEVAP